MLKRAMTFILLGLMWLALVGAAAWLILLAAAISRHATSKQIVVGDFTKDGDASTDLAGQFFDRWVLYQTAGQNRARNSNSPETGFVLAEISERTGDQLSPIAELTKDTTVTVAGFNVTGFVTTITSMIANPAERIEGRLRTTDHEVNLITRFVGRDGKVAKSWALSRAVSETASAASKTKIEAELMDEAVFEVASYLHLRRPQPHSNGNESRLLDPTDPDVPAAAHLHNGQRNLDRYHRTQSTGDLTQAQMHFRELVARRPRYVDGLMLLGFTLAEKRQEAEAASVYKRVIDELTPPRDGKRREPAEQLPKQLIEARFLHSSCRLRQYRFADAVAAGNEFLALAADLEATTGLASQPDIEWYHRARYMLARAYGEAAHCYGHLITLLPKDRQLDPAEYADAQKVATIAALPSLEELADAKRRIHLASAYRDECQKLIDKARAIEISDLDWKGDLDARLNQVEGYAQYRYTEWLPPAGDGDVAFRDACDAALHKLQAAELRTPRSYELLQQIGMIYLNRRRDPEGKYLDLAKEYYSRSSQLKPNDYYAHEQLARTAARRAIIAPPGELRTNSVADGLARVKGALERFPILSSAVGVE